MRFFFSVYFAVFLAFMVNNGIAAPLPDHPPDVQKTAAEWKAAEARQRWRTAIRGVQAARAAQQAAARPPPSLQRQNGGLNGMIRQT